MDHIRRVVLVALVARAADALPYCTKIGTEYLSSDDVSACGLGNVELFWERSNLYYDKKCRSPACMRLYAAADALNPTECAVSFGYALAFRSGVLAPLYAACAALDAPTTAAPVSSPAPVPGPGPAAPSVATTPKPSTTAPTPSSATTTSTTTESPARSTTRPTAGASSSGSHASSEKSPTASPPTSSNSATPDKTPTPEVTSAEQGSVAVDPTPVATNESHPATRTTAPAGANTSTAEGKNGSQQTLLWVVVSVTVVVMLSLSVLWKLRRQKRPSKTGNTNTTGGDDLSTNFLASDDIGNDALFSSAWRQQMDAQLRRDRALELWRVDIQTITDKHLVGKGAHAFVHLVVLTDGTKLASKRLTVDQITPEKFEMLVEEAHIVSSLQHASIVAFAGVAWTTALDFQVLFEFMKGGDLRSYLDKHPANHDGWSSTTLQMAIAIAEGLTYTHSFNPPLVHRDLKSRNILLTKDLQAKISDFGVSRFQSENDTMTTGIGTNRWLAPEVLAGGGSYDERCDIYSFGVVLTELDTHDVPLVRELEADGKKRSELWLLQEVASGRVRPSLSPSCPDAIRDLATRCLTMDPHDRPNALEVSFKLRSMVKESTRAVLICYSNK